MNEDYYAPKGTFSVEGECEKGVSKIHEIRVANAIHNFLSEEGYERSENPDLLIQFFIKESAKSFLTQECDYYERWEHGEQCAVRVVNYQEGSIVIDIIDTQNQSIIWHGAIYGPPFNELQDPSEKINRFVGTLLDDYFLGHKSS